MPFDHAGLCARFAAGERPPLWFFWGQDSILSQWFPAPFTVAGDLYWTAEHWMMAEKARLFGDSAALEKIVSTRHPGEAKRLGRSVRGYNDAQWNAVRFETVVRGNVHKFSGHLRLQLTGTGNTGTGNAVLVEASPYDRIWGIGLNATAPEAQDPRTWRGQNLLGFALMEARQRLRDKHNTAEGSD